MLNSVAKICKITQNPDAINRPNRNEETVKTTPARSNFSGANQIGKASSDLFG